MAKRFGPFTICEKFGELWGLALRKSSKKQRRVATMFAAAAVAKNTRSVVARTEYMKAAKATYDSIRLLVQTMKAQRLSTVRSGNSSGMK